MQKLESPIIDRFSTEPPPDCLGSQLTWNNGDDGQDPFFYDRKFRHHIFQSKPDRLARNMAKIYKETYTRKGRKQANIELREMDSKLSEFDYKLACNDHALIRHSELLASNCRRHTSSAISNKRKIRVLAKIARKQGIELPNKPASGIISRLIDPIWWRRNLRKKHRRGLEEAQILMNMVNKRRGLYVSDEGVKCHRELKLKNRELLRSIIAINELDQEFTLEELSDKSPSNPEIRRSELMMRIFGHENYSKENDETAVFYTITCPSRMHASHSQSGDRNSKYDKTTPKEAHQHLNLVWRRIRSKLNRDGLRIHGIRVVEPHHDGTPHWHLLVFLGKNDLHAINKIIYRYALQDSPDEPGAQKIRVTYKLVDPDKGSAIGYVAKYISKNIDGFGMGTDKTGKREADKAERVLAWASAHNIRQFQFFGDAPVSVWRELRRLSPEGLPDNLLRECCEASDNNDWCRYMNLMGGHKTPRKDMPISLLKVWSDRPGRYGEPIGDLIKGLNFDDQSYISRVHTWKIELKSIKYTDSIPTAQVVNLNTLLKVENIQEIENLRPLEFCQ